MSYRSWYTPMILMIHLHDTHYTCHDTRHDTHPWYSRYTLSWYTSMILMIKYTSWYTSMIHVTIHLHDTHDQIHVMIHIHDTLHDTPPWYTFMILMIHLHDTHDAPPWYTSMILMIYLHDTPPWYSWYTLSVWPTFMVEAWSKSCHTPSLTPTIEFHPRISAYSITDQSREHLYSMSP